MTIAVHSFRRKMLNTVNNDMPFVVLFLHFNHYLIYVLVVDFVTDKLHPCKIKLGFALFGQAVSNKNLYITTNQCFSNTYIIIFVNHSLLIQNSHPLKLPLTRNWEAHPKPLAKRNITFVNSPGSSHRNCGS